MDPQAKNTLLSDAFLFLSQESMGVIATATHDNIPQAASVNYMIDKDWTVYILTLADSRKVQNIKQNNHVAFVVGVAQIPHTAQMQADATIIDMDNKEYESAFAKLKESGKLARDPMYDMFSSNYVILKLHITWLRWLYFEQGTGKSVYTVLIP